LDEVPNVAFIRRHHRITTVDRTLDHRHIHDLEVIGLCGQHPDSSSLLLAHRFHPAETEQAHKACLPASPLHAAASTGAGPVGATSSASRPACEAHIR